MSSREAGGGLGGGVIHGLGAVICTEEIKENGMEPFWVNDIGLNVCCGNCQFAPAPGVTSFAACVTPV